MVDLNYEMATKNMAKVFGDRYNQRVYLGLATSCLCTDLSFSPRMHSATPKIENESFGGDIKLSDPRNLVQKGSWDLITQGS